MLTKNEIAGEIEAATGIKTNLVKRVLDELAALAADEVSSGNDFVVPGIAKLAFHYRAPQKKGERWKKGATRVGFGGIEQVADSDSPPVKEAVKLKASPTGAVAKQRPGSKPEAQAAFLKSAAGKAVRARKRR